LKCVECRKKITPESRYFTKRNWVAHNEIRTDKNYPRCDDCYCKAYGLSKKQMLEKFVEVVKFKTDGDGKRLYRDNISLKETTSTVDSDDRNNFPITETDTTKTTKLINKYLGKGIVRSG